MLLNNKSINVFCDDILIHDPDNTDIKTLNILRQVLDPQINDIFKNFTLDDYHSLPIIISELINPNYLQVQLSNLEHYGALEHFCIDTD